MLSDIGGQYGHRHHLAFITPLACCQGAPMISGDALPSWNDGATKRAILEFVARVSDDGGPDFVPVEERIAVFDNDGTLWPEQPMPTQLVFALDRVKQLAPSHPDWKGRQPFKSVLEGDLRARAAGGERGIAEILAATHAGNTSEEFTAIVERWIDSVRHPRYERPYPEVVYQPMLEVLRLMRANRFRTFIVSGGGVEFMRPWAERAYGIPPEQVIGSRARLRYEVRSGKPVLTRQPEVELVDNKAGKPVGIAQVIGRRPIAAFGNSDGDFEMLEWTTAAKGRRLGVIVHHTDAVREWAYDRDYGFAPLARGLLEAPERGWTVVDMKRDWKLVFGFQR